MDILSFLKVDTYYGMSNHELELEAAKYKIDGYGTSEGRVVREGIITQLLEKDRANNSRYAIIVAFIALFVSIVALIYERG